MWVWPQINMSVGREYLQCCVLPLLCQSKHKHTSSCSTVFIIDYFSNQMRRRSLAHTLISTSKGIHRDCEQNINCLFKKLSGLETGYLEGCWEVLTKQFLNDKSDKSLLACRVGWTFNGPCLQRACERKWCWTDSLHDFTCVGRTVSCQASLWEKKTLDFPVFWAGCFQSSSCRILT